MTPGFDRFPERPPSEVEWEELLVRYEITPRALRLAVEDASPGAAGRIAAPLGRLLAWERWTAGALEALREGRSVTPPETASSPDDPSADPMRTVEEISALRGRSFAAVQRRGIDVWNWSGALPDGTTLTPFRLLSAAVAMDGAVLADVRRGG